MPGIFDLSLRINGFPLHKAKQKVTELLQVPATYFTPSLERLKKEIVEFHLKNNPFYNEICGGASYTTWAKLPVMVKSDYQRPLEERISNGYSTDKIYINKTSGSGGHPMVFAKDKFCHALVWANTIRRFGWYGIDFNNSYQARFYGRPTDRFANLKLQFKDIVAGRYRFSIFDLSDAALEKIVSKFASKKFDYINGYTSSIVLLAKYLKAKNLVLKDICPTLKVCVVTSEMLFDDDKKLLETHLGIPIINEYGASELEIIAFQNKAGQWAVNAETLFVEILDDDNNPLPNGEEGRIVVTALFNKAHPFIRYDVGDYGILDESSTLKQPILKKLTGRTNDFALLPSGKKPAGMTFYSITKKLFGDEGNVKEFVVRQSAIDIFEIDYTSETELSKPEIEKMSATFDSYLESGLTYVFTRKHSLERNASGKLKQFSRTFTDGIS